MLVHASRALGGGDEQDRVGRSLLDELADEEDWTQRFEASHGALTTLAAQARADRAARPTTDIDPDNL